jgi:hypothetical protein
VLELSIVALYGASTRVRLPVVRGAAMIEPSRLSLEHRVGTPPGTVEMIGTLATPTGGHVLAAFGRGAVVLC